MFKFKLFLQKTFFRLVMLAAIAAFVGVFYFAVKLEEGNKPPEVLKLPAEVQFGAPAIDGQDRTGANALAVQHMGSREVAVKLTEIIAESLSFNQSDYRSVTTGVQKYFTTEGYQQYVDFLRNSAFETSLAQNLQSGAYVAGEPQELARGVYDGVFKWVFETPVTISLIPRNMDGYRGDSVQPQNRNFTLRAQIARVNDPQDPNAIKIELWQALPPRTR